MKKLLALISLVFSLNAFANVASFEDGMNGFVVAGASRFTYAQEATKNAAGGDFFLAGASGSGVVIRRTDGAAFTFEGADFHSRAGIRESSTISFILDGVFNEEGTTDRKGFVEHVLQPGEVNFIQIAYNQPIRTLGIFFKHPNNDWKYFGMDNLRTNASVTPVPEPETWAMLLAGVLTIGYIKGRRT